MYKNKNWFKFVYKKNKWYSDIRKVKRGDNKEKWECIEKREEGIIVIYKGFGMCVSM